MTEISSVVNRLMKPISMSNQVHFIVGYHTNNKVRLKFLVESVPLTIELELLIGNHFVINESQKVEIIQSLHFFNR